MESLPYGNIGQNIVEHIKSVAGEENVRINEPMKNHTSFKVGGVADILVTPEDISALEKIINICKAEKLPYFIMGNGTNLIVRDKGIRGVVIKTSDKLNRY